MYISSVKVNPSCLTLKKGSWYDYATVKVNNIDCDYCIEWYSEDPTVASVHPETGRIFGVNDGTTRIYVKSIADDYQKDYITVTVTSSAINVECIQLNKTSIRLEEGDTFELTATVCPEYATNKSINWTSSNESVATVTDGVITAKSLGTAYICAEAKDGSGEEAICSVEVTDDVLVRSITLDQSECTIAANGAVWLRETVCPEDATNKRVVWSSSNPEIVFVNPNGGLSSAQGKEGQAKIIATAEDNGGAYAECIVNVNPPIPVTGIDICATKLSLCVGEIGCVCACALPSYADNKRVRYTSSDSSVASVDVLTGYVTAKKVGTTTITATTDDGGFTKTCEVRVYIDTVTIQKDGNFSKVIFSDGRIWKCDNYYSTDAISNVPVNPERANHNKSIEFTKKELGLLFRIDPNGVIYYVQNSMCINTETLVDYLLYKDDLFEEIYGRRPQYFKYENSQLYYCFGVNKETRYLTHSEAELIFGMHAIVTITDFAKFFWDVFVSIASIYIPALGTVLACREIVTAFFFTGALDGAVSAVASEYISNLDDENYIETKMPKLLSWSMTVVNLIFSLAELIIPPEIDEELILVYENAYRNESYKINISDGNKIVDLNKFIEHYKSLL